MENLQANLTLIQQRLAVASDGKYPIPKLIAVTKTHPAEDILPLQNLGVTDIGENKVQEIMEKLPALEKNFRIHLIGRLQSNKVKYIIDHVCLIHSVDRLSLAQEIDRQAQKHNRVMPVLIQVSPCGEAQKGGLPHEELMPFLRTVSQLPGLPGETPAQLLSELLARLTAEDMESLQHYEERLTALEEVLLAQQAEDFDKKIFRIRRKLSVLAGYYAQLDDLYAVLADAIPDAEEHVQRLLEHLSGKAQRLLTMTEQEKEYSLQLREMHQTQVDMRQNQIMKILTIVTTVFLPLSLIAGWYGMNFRNMPELTAEHGYLVICIVSVVCVLVELWIFKRKKWF